MNSLQKLTIRTMSKLLFFDRETVIFFEEDEDRPSFRYSLPDMFYCCQILTGVGLVTNPQREIRYGSLNGEESLKGITSPLLFCSTKKEMMPITYPSMIYLHNKDFYQQLSKFEILDQWVRGINFNEDIFPSKEELLVMKDKVLESGMVAGKYPRSWNYRKMRL